MACFRLPWPKHYVYESLLFTHHCLSVVLLYSLWHYFLNEPRNKLFLMIAIGVYGALALIRFCRLVWRSYFWRRGCSRALVRRCGGEGEGLVVTITLTRSLLCKEALAGRYIYISAVLPGAVFSPFQRHPYMVAWWHDGEGDTAGDVASGQDTTLSLLIQSQRGFSRKLAQHADTGRSLLVAIDGPYGFHVATHPYRSIVLFATDIGIAAQMSIMRQAIEQYHERNGAVTRILLAWEVQRRGKLHSLGWRCTD